MVSASIFLSHASQPCSEVPFLSSGGQDRNPHLAWSWVCASEGPFSDPRLETGPWRKACIHAAPFPAQHCCQLVTLQSYFLKHLPTYLPSGLRQVAQRGQDPATVTQQWWERWVSKPGLRAPCGVEDPLSLFCGFLFYKVGITWYPPHRVLLFYFMRNKWVAIYKNLVGTKCSVNVSCYCYCYHIASQDLG